MLIQNTGVAKRVAEYIATNKIGISTMSHPYKLAHLQRPADSTLKKKWYVTFWIFCETKQELIRKRIVISGKTVEEREAVAQEVITDLNKKLVDGNVMNPITPAPVTRKSTDVFVINKNLTLAEGISHYLLLKEKTMKGRGFETYESNARTFVEFLEKIEMLEKPLRTFKVEHARAYTDWILLDKKLSNKSHNKHKGFASGIFNEFVDREIITKNPFKKVKKLRTTQGKHRVFTPDQIQEFRELCEKEQDSATWFFVCWIYYTFMRPHEEARFLRIQDIREKTILVTEQNAKMSRVRHVLIPPALEAMITERKLREYPGHYYVFSYDGIPSSEIVSESYWYRRHVKYMKHMDLYGHDYDLYGWKHTGATSLFKATKDLLLVQNQCGHTDVKQTVEYLRDLGALYYESQIEKFPEI